MTDGKEHAENSATLAQCKRGTSPHNAEQGIAEQGIAEQGIAEQGIAEQRIAEQRIEEQRIVGPDTAMMLNRGMHHE